MCSCVVLEGPSPNKTFQKSNARARHHAEFPFLGRMVQYFFGLVVCRKKIVQILQPLFSRLIEAVARLGVLRLDY